jgi:hypothetical protein
MKVERRHQNAKARVHFAEVGVDQHGIFVDLFPYVVHQQQKHAPLSLLLHLPRLPSFLGVVLDVFQQVLVRDSKFHVVLGERRAPVLH